MKTLDMADKYPPAEDDYDNGSLPTIKVQVPVFIPQVIVGDEDPDGTRDTIPSPPPAHMETTYPGVGLLIVLGFGFSFWSLVAYFIFR
jgi:hypothetical protein